MFSSTCSHHDPGARRVLRPPCALVVQESGPGVGMSASATVVSTQVRDGAKLPRPDPCGPGRLGLASRL